MNVAAIDAVIAELRRTYPELQQPLTWDTMTLILQREGITLLKLPLMHDAQVISCDGVSVMAINSNASPRRHTYHAAHEWGHIKLHFREPGEIVYHMSPCWPDDPREDEAEYFATRLLMGPIGDAADSVAAPAPTAAPRYRRREEAPPPAQGSLALPPDPPMPYAVVHPAVASHPEDHMDDLLRRHSPRLRARLVARDRADAAKRAVQLDLRPRVEFVKDGRARKHYLIDRDGRRWRIYDMVPPGRKSASLKLFPSEPPNNWAAERVFVAEDGERRHYEFKYREPRPLDAEVLERQLRNAS